MKKIIVSVFLVALMLVYPVFNLISLGSEGNKNEVTADNSAQSIINTLDEYDAAKAQAAVIKAEKKRQDPTGIKQKVKLTLKKLKQGKTTYRKVFRNVYIVGDSLMNGLEAYDILNSNHLITQVSASLYHLDENIDKIISMNPPVLIIHYGVNMISNSDAQRENFISFYTKLVKRLKKALPGTRIIISGLFPVDRSVAKAARFAAVPEYNKSLKAMCKKLGIEFMDSSPVLKKHKECYGGDGIHLSKAFYEKYWLNFIIEEMGITI